MPGTVPGYITRASDTGHPSDRIIFLGIAQWTDVFGGGLSNGEIITMGASMISDSISAPNWGPDGDVYNFGLPRRDPDYGYVYMELTGGALHGGTAQSHTVSTGDPIPDNVNLWGYFGRSFTGTFDYFQIFPVTFVHPLNDIDVDRTPFGGTRMVLGQGGGSVTLRRYFDLETTPDDVGMAFTGANPAICCLPDGTHWVCVSGVGIVHVDDEGNIIDIMPSPGAGYRCDIYRSPDDDGPVWVAFAAADSGTTDLKVYRTYDHVGLTGWESAVTVVSSVAAQSPRLVGNGAEIQFWYVDTLNVVQGKRSLDQGATWTAIP